MQAQVAVDLADDERVVLGDGGGVGTDQGVAVPGAPDQLEGQSAVAPGQVRPGRADEAIGVNGAKGVLVDRNTVLSEGTFPASISVRFDSTTATVTNNLTNRQVIERDGARATSSGNVTWAERSWFVNPMEGDLHLSSDGESKAAATGAFSNLAGASGR